MATDHFQATVPFSVYGVPTVSSFQFSPYSTTPGLGVGTSYWNVQGTFSVPYGYQDAYSGVQNWYDNTYNDLSNVYQTASDPGFWMNYTHSVQTCTRTTSETRLGQTSEVSETSEVFLPELTTLLTPLLNDKEYGQPGAPRSLGKLSPFL
jgi:hypothetical protein